MDILSAFLDLVQAVGLLVWAILQAILPWIPLLAWIAFWTLAVDWIRLRAILLQGGWIGVLLIALTAVLVWGVVAPPVEGTHSLLGLHVSNFVGKMMYVTALLVIMLLCGSVQLSGLCDRFLNLQQPTAGGHGDHHPESHSGGHDGDAHHPADGHAVPVHVAGH